MMMFMSSSRIDTDLRPSVLVTIAPTKSLRTLIIMMLIVSQMTPHRAAHLMLFYFCRNGSFNYSPDWQISSIHDVGLSSASAHDLNQTHDCAPSLAAGLIRRSEFVLQGLFLWLGFRLIISLIKSFYSGFFL